MNLLDFVRRVGIRTADKWGVANVLLRLASPFLFIPFLVRNLDAHELGTWYLLLAACGFVVTLETGVSATVSRAVGLFKGGAESLTPNGYVTGGSSSPNTDALGKLVSTSRLMGFSVAALLLSGVVVGLPSIEAKFGSQIGDFGILRQLSLVLCGMMGATVLSGHASGIVIGLNRQDLILKRSFIVGILQNVAGVIVLSNGGRLLALSETYLAGAIATWLWNEYSLHRCCKDENIRVKSLHFDLAIFNALRPTWLKSSAVSFGAFFVMNAGTLVAGTILGLGEAARWGLTMQAVGALNSFCQIAITSIMPEMSVLRGADKISDILNIFGKRLRLSLVMFILGGVALVAAGDSLLGLVGAKTTLISAGCLIGALLVQLLEFNHSAHGAVVLSGNRNPFALVSIFGGAGILITSYWLGGKFGILGLVLGRGIVQACIVNWWPIILAARDLGFRRTSDYVCEIYGLGRHRIHESAG